MDTYAFPNKMDGPAYDGMTLRDYFAAAALQGICASQFIADHAPKGEPEAIAKRAGEIADAMIAERSKRYATAFQQEQSND